MELRLRVELAEDEEPGDDAEWIAQLQEELDELDEAQLTAEPVDGPAGARGIGLAAILAKLAAESVGKLVNAVIAFAARTGRTVEVSIGKDSIKITGASREQQDKVIGAWLARHPASS